MKHIMKIKAPDWQFDFTDENIRAFCNENGCFIAFGQQIIWPLNGITINKSDLKDLTNDILEAYKSGDSSFDLLDWSMRKNHNY